MYILVKLTLPPDIWVVRFFPVSIPENEALFQTGLEIRSSTVRASAGQYVTFGKVEPVYA